MTRNSRSLFISAIGWLAAAASLLHLRGLCTLIAHVVGTYTITLWGMCNTWGGTNQACVCVVKTMCSLGDKFDTLSYYTTTYNDADTHTHRLTHIHQINLLRTASAIWQQQGDSWWLHIHIQYRHKVIHTGLCTTRHHFQVQREQLLSVVIWGKKRQNTVLNAEDKLLIAAWERRAFVAAQRTWFD